LPLEAADDVPAAGTPRDEVAKGSDLERLGALLFFFSQRSVPEKYAAVGTGDLPLKLTVRRVEDVYDAWPVLVIEAFIESRSVLVVRRSFGNFPVDVRAGIGLV
jgi:hypothetical protein